MKNLYDELSFKTSEITTKKYSTSFSHGIKLFHKKFHQPIYAIYGFVRIADEIVDSFHGFDKEVLLNRFVSDTWLAIQEGISMNPVLHSFQQVVNQYGIERELIEAFIKSMRMDLNKQDYSQKEYEEYIVGSAEVVGLMCLRVFCEGNQEIYNELKYPAMRLGSAFQKINFLRDLKADYQNLGRSYFPGVDLSDFDTETKLEIQVDIEKDFMDGLSGIKKLPKGSQLGVYIAYRYYWYLFKKIKKLSPETIMDTRVRIPDGEKYYIMMKSFMRSALNIL